MSWLDRDHEIEETHIQGFIDREQELVDGYQARIFKLERELTHERRELALRDEQIQRLEHKLAPYRSQIAADIIGQQTGQSFDREVEDSGLELSS